MNDALYVAATGLRAQQSNVDTVANNLANVMTPGFKKGRVNFADLMVAQQTARAEGAAPTTPTAMSGAGVVVGEVGKLFGVGDIRKTGEALDLAIAGAGFIEVVMPDGGVALSRGGSLQVSSEGLLMNGAGLPLKAGITLPAGVRDIGISADGLVSARVGAKNERVELGRLDLLMLPNPEGLQALGDGVYRVTPTSGEPIAVRPGEEGAGVFAQGALEFSNVVLTDEMVNLMVAQRAYSMNVKVAQAADELMSLTNNLRKG